MSQLRGSTTAILLAIAATCLHLQISAGAPQTAGPTATMGSLTADPQCGPECRSFQHSYCNSFNYGRARFPNPRQEKESELPNGIKTYEDDAFREFNDFGSLLDTGCSNKLGTLLCFFYFPFCINDPTIQVRILPCRSLCQEVVSDCAEDLEMVFAQQGHSNRGWKDLPHFNCTHYTFDGCNGPKGEPVFIEEEGMCANETQAPWPVPVLPPSTTVKTSPTPPPSTEAPKPETSPTDAPKPETSPTDAPKPETSPKPGPKDISEEGVDEEITEVPEEAVCSPCTGIVIECQCYRIWS